MMHLLAVASNVLLLSLVSDCIVESNAASFFHSSCDIGSDESRFPTAFASGISEKCHGDTLHYIKSLNERQPWALTMYESSGRLNAESIGPGPRNNVRHDFGYFDDCLVVEEPERRFYGQHCTVFFETQPVEQKETHLFSALKTSRVNEPRVAPPSEKLSNFLLPSTGFCLPSSCSANDLRWAVAQVIADYQVRAGMNNVSIVTMTDENYCFSRAKNNETDTAFTIVMATFSVLIMLVIISTIVDTCAQDSLRHLKGASVLKCFSLIRNRKALLLANSGPDDKKDDFSCLHGVRVLSTFMIVLFHHGEDLFTHAGYNQRKLFKHYILKLDFHVMNMMGGLPVDNFFMMSAILMTYFQLNHLTSNNGQFGILRFYAKRWLRLTPLYAAVVAFVATVYPHLGDGPQWSYIRIASRKLRETWWANMLYINNYYPKSEYLVRSPSAPIMETWYLACEMQLFVLSPLLIYTLWRWKRIGLIMAFLTLIGVAIANVALFIAEELPAIFLLSRPSYFAGEAKYFELFYMQTYTRSPPYIIGILIGWFLHNNKGKRCVLSKATVAIGWTIAASLTGLILFSLFPYIDEEKAPVINPYLRVAFGSLHHTAWSAVIAWVIFACFYGYGGFINDILSWSVFVPLGKLCYAIYLIHYNFIRFQSCQSRLPLFFDTTFFFPNFFGTLTMATLMALAAHLFLELPFLNLEKLYFRS